jgi:hypothetical protein
MRTLSTPLIRRTRNLTEDGEDDGRLVLQTVVSRSASGRSL